MAEPLPQHYRLPDDDDALLDECDVTLFMASGPGGQHRNRTMSAVRLRHRPSGLIVIGRRNRSQHRNRADALERLRGRLREMLTPRRPRVATKPSRRARRRRVDEKKRRGDVKRLRGRVRRDEG